MGELTGNKSAELEKFLAQKTSAGEMKWKRGLRNYLLSPGPGEWVHWRRFYWANYLSRRYAMFARGTESGRFWPAEFKLLVWEKSKSGPSEFSFETGVRMANGRDSLLYCIEIVLFASLPEAVRTAEDRAEEAIEELKGKEIPAPSSLSRTSRMAAIPDPKDPGWEEYRQQAIQDLVDHLEGVES